MKRSEKSIKKRTEFVNLAVCNPDQAAKDLVKLAKQLIKAKNMAERVKLLSELLFLSESTIFHSL